MSPSLAAALLLIAAGAGPAHAIPSPELIVGSFVSISQLFALASAVLGGGAAYATVRARRRGGQASKSLVATAVVLFALLTVSVGVNIWQYTTYASERQARLEDTLVRPARTPGSLPLDPENRETSYSQQMASPMGLTTDEAQALLDAVARGERNDIIFLDIRERPERLSGTIPGLRYVRYQDINSANIDFTGKQAILFCHNGNRSSETCAALRQQGIDCRFLKGGFEKWVVEARPLEGGVRKSLEELRAIPPYPNAKTLLDLPEVRRLVAEENAVFVDVRYPWEFKNHGHLPGAINLPSRKLAWADLTRAIAELPRRPIILPCYDRRTCFAAEVLGYELTQVGHDYRGRFTLPWTYFTPNPRPPHVEAWIAENNRTLFEKAARWLAAQMITASQGIGLVAVILLLAALSRLLVLPFSLKAERDQIRSRAVRGELEALKARLRHDPVRKTRAIRAFYSRHGLTPVRNLLALLFLPVMAVALLAVQEAAVQTSTAFLWIGDLAGRDPLHILPVVFGVLITLYVELAFASTWKHRALIWGLVFPAMIATGLLLGAAGDLYLIASAALLLVQRLWVTGAHRALARAIRRRRLPKGVIALDDPERLAGHGNKAHRLAQMRAAGLPVPDGLLLTPAFVQSLAEVSPAERERALERIWRRLGRARLAVRSSAAFEDGAEHSFAGVFESVLDVGRAELSGAIAKVRDSYAAAHVGVYHSDGGTGSVLVQRMVQADYAGVMFTRDPAAAGLMMVEMVQGTAQDLVSGAARPFSYRFGRITGKNHGRTNPPIDLAPLLELGRKAEALFGGPQDVEWTCRDGRFFLVQSRDITRTGAGQGDAAAQEDLARAIDRARRSARDLPADAAVFGKNELAEMLPRPTPLSLSLMEALWAAGGSIDLAARRLGLDYPAAEDSTYLVTVLGRLYVNKREERARALAIGPAARRRLLRRADAIENEFRQAFLPEFLAQTRMLAVADFDKLTAAELVAEIRRLHDRFVHDTHVAVDVINIAAFAYLDHARRALTRAGIDASAVLGHIPETAESRALAEIAATPDKSARWLSLQHFGHRAALDYELAEPRYGEDTDALERMVAARAPKQGAAAEPPPVLSGRLGRALAIARRFQTLKEDAKHHSLRELALIRKALLALDRKLGFEGQIFQLTFPEILAMDVAHTAALRARAEQRQAQAAELRRQPSPPSLLTAPDLEAATAGNLGDAHASSDVIRGTRVSGSKVAEGRAHVVTGDAAEAGDAMQGFREGDIIVATVINPAWLPYFSRAGGFISEVGGWLSHPAILAREYDVPMLVGVEGLGRIGHGDTVRLHLDGRVEVVAKAEQPQPLGRVAAA